jgi:hypothetical protein
MEHDPTVLSKGAAPDEDHSAQAAARGAAYSAPVADLLTIGDPRSDGAEAQIAALSFGQAHVPELVRMALDAELHNAFDDTLEVWAPLHALCILKRLDASAYVTELMPLVELDDDWFSDELPKLFAAIGQPAMAPLQAYLDDETNDEWGQIVVVNALSELGQCHPELRDEVIGLLSAVWQDSELYDEDVRTEALDALIELGAVNPATLTELDEIEEMVHSTWDAILGQIGAERDLKYLEALSASEAAHAPAEDTARKARPQRSAAQARKEKQKRKAASAARKTNRKKRK